MPELIELLSQILSKDALGTFVKKQTSALSSKLGSKIGLESTNFVKKFNKSLASVDPVKFLLQRQSYFENEEFKKQFPHLKKLYEHIKGIQKTVNENIQKLTKKKPREILQYLENLNKEKGEKLKYRFTPADVGGYMVSTWVASNGYWVPTTPLTDAKLKTAYIIHGILFWQTKTYKVRYETPMSFEQFTVMCSNWHSQGGHGAGSFLAYSGRHLVTPPWRAQRKIAKLKRIETKRIAKAQKYKASMQKKVK